VDDQHGIEIWEHAGKENATDELLRSKLYSLAPAGIGTPWIECLTSYVNRLAWMYRVEPRVLVAQEIVPHLNGSYHFRSSLSLLGAFCRSEAMSINGAGGSAIDWSDTLERLTMRMDLRDLTLRAWAGDIPSQGLLRAAPSWCPVCYHEWQEKGLPIYQPLLWMLQIMTVCLRHRRRLEVRCPNCRKKQSVIAARTQPGYCTQCMAWLGMPRSSGTETALDNGTYDWQQWVLDIIEELRKASAASSFLSWEQIPHGLILCSKIVGSTKQLASLAGIPKRLLSSWKNHKQMPSFERMLEFCYALDISPLQLMTAIQDDLNEALQSKERHRQPRPRHYAPHPVNREDALALIQAVLDGREAPMGVRQLERRLGLGPRTLVYHFPRECALITDQYQAYRAEQARQRIERGSNEVHQVTLMLYAEGTNPSARQVASRLSDPGVMRTVKGLTTWHAARRELGLEL
jgi:transcriptional regulator with XRE-family HTH domain